MEIKEHHVEAICDRILKIMTDLHPKIAKSLSSATYSEPFSALSNKDKRLAKVRILGEEHPAEFNQALTQALNPQTEDLGVTRSNFASFIENMPNLKGINRISYKETSGGNYKKL